MFKIWRREGSGGSGSSKKEDEGEQGKEWRMVEEVMREGVDEVSGEIDASLSSPVKGGDPFSASEDEIRAIEDWWSQKEEAEEEVEEEGSEEGEGGVVSGEEGDESTDLISRLKEIGSEEEEEETTLMREMEELGNLSVEDLLILAKEIREGVEKIEEERKDRLGAVEESASARAREEVEEEAKDKREKARDENSRHHAIHRVFSS